MEIAIQKAARSKYGFEHDIRATIDRKTGAISLARYREVVDEIVPAEGEEDDSQNATKILLEDALAYDENAKVGDFIIDELPPIDFGRIAAQTAKQVIVQKVRDAERNKQFEEYKEKVGTIINGTIKRIEFGNVILDIGKAEAILRRDEIIPRENLKTATGFALMSLMFAARIKGRRFSFPVLVRNSWPSCLRRRFRKFMTAWLKLWALPVIRVQKRKLPLKPMI